MSKPNEGFNPDKITKLRDQLSSLGVSYLVNNEEENGDDYVSFYFIGNYQGSEVIFDAVIYTLRLHHSSELFEYASHIAAKNFPNYKKIKYEEDENGNLKALDDLEEEIGLFMAEVMAELEEEETIKVKEHIEIDDRLDFGVGLEACLNVEKVTEKVIESFIKKFNNNTLKLDEKPWSFHSEEIYPIDNRIVMN